MIWWFHYFLKVSLCSFFGEPVKSFPWQFVYWCWSKIRSAWKILLHELSVELVIGRMSSRIIFLNLFIVIPTWALDRDCDSSDGYISDHRDNVTDNCDQECGWAQCGDVCINVYVGDWCYCGEEKLNIHTELYFYRTVISTSCRDHVFAPKKGFVKQDNTFFKIFGLNDSVLWSSIKYR